MSGETRIQQLKGFRRRRVRRPVVLLATAVLLFVTGVGPAWLYQVVGYVGFIWAAVVSVRLSDLNAQIRRTDPTEPADPGPTESLIAAYGLKQVED